MKETTKATSQTEVPSRGDDRVRAERAARDLEIINRNAEELNRDAVDGLEYQAPEDWDSPEIL
jgi:hypothetical protein